MSYETSSRQVTELNQTSILDTVSCVVQAVLQQADGAAGSSEFVSTRDECLVY